MISDKEWDRIKKFNPSNPSKADLQFMVDVLAREHAAGKSLDQPHVQKLLKQAQERGIQPSEFVSPTGRKRSARDAPNIQRISTATPESERIKAAFRRGGGKDE